MVVQPISTSNQRLILNFNIVIDSYRFSKYLFFELIYSQRKSYMPMFNLLCHLNYLLYDKNLFMSPLTFVELPIGYSCVSSKFIP